MDLVEDRCYRALKTRDRRFDGRFFTGVKSTGVYCRPVCPARTPRREHCVFFACAAGAEDAGFRACRRCRPEAAPGSAAWQGTSATVARAVRLIEGGGLPEGGVPQLAARLGVGERHLRRLFLQQLGASPKAIAQTRRAHFAKHLIEHTALSMTQIALASGFAQARTFNRAMMRSFARTPTELRARRRAPRPEEARQVVLRIPFAPPMDGSSLLGFLRLRAVPGVEQVDEEVYRRTVQCADFRGVIAVQIAPKDQPYLLLSAPIEAAPYLAAFVARTRELFDTEAPVQAIFEQLASAPELAGAAGRWPGLRVPGAWDHFEVAVRAILGQQISVKGATTLAGRLVQQFGEPLATVSPALTHLFPGPERLAAAELERIGLPRARAETIRALARAVHEGGELLELAADLEQALVRLRALPGVGDWTAQYIAMRALREPDAFPAGDLVLRKALASGAEPAPVHKVRMQAEAWRPWRAYAAMLLWRDMT